MNSSDSPALTERLAAVLAADAVGYSRLMQDNERTTLAALDDFRAVFRVAIERHHGRVVDMAGDSVLAMFDSATAAVQASLDIQLELARRNEAVPLERRLRYRIGVNLGDILVKDDGSIYGSGVNVAARLQALAPAGGVAVSGSVFEAVRAKIERAFVFLGDHELKNISAPVPVYRITDLGDVEQPTEAKPAASSAANTAATEKQRHTVIVLPFQLISGGEEIQSLAAGLYQDILNGLTRQSALDVIGGVGPDTISADFRLEGSLRVAGDRLRLSFSLFDCGAQRQVWSERYDRQRSDIFALEDEISRSVASAVRLRIKAGAFEKLRNKPNDALSVPELLSKAAGLFIESYGHNDEAAEILAAAIARQPDRSMAHAMLVFCRYRACEYSAFSLAEPVIVELLDQSHLALSIDNASYFAHLMAALIHHDLRGDFNAARVHAETALNLNPSFSQAMAMTGIARIHLGDVTEGLQLLRNGIEAAPDDPHRFRHLRELALGYLINDEPARAAETIDKLIHQAPDLLRNELIAAPVFWQAGRQADAKQRIARLLAREPGATLTAMRPTQIGNTKVAAMMRENLSGAGLPD